MRRLLASRNCYRPLYATMKSWASTTRLRTFSSPVAAAKLLNMTLSAILNEGDEILVPEPYYSNYKTFTRMAGGVPVPIPTLPEKGYRITSREEIEAHITPRTRAMLFTNPNNPTGVVMSNEELRMLADVAKEHELFLIADEVYREFVYEGEIPMSVGAFEDLAENAIIIDSVSKRFSACGARGGMHCLPKPPASRAACKAQPGQTLRGDH